MARQTAESGAYAGIFWDLLSINLTTITSTKEDYSMREDFRSLPQVDVFMIDNPLVQLNHLLCGTFPTFRKRSLLHVEAVVLRKA